MNRISQLEYDYVKEVLDTGFRASKGAIMMTRLEEKFKETFGMNYAISHMNGTATMHSILEAADIGPGDEVIVPPLTMASTAFVVLQAGATPIFADVDYETFQIDPAAIAERITDKTRAIITVALYGLSPDMDPIMKLAEKYNLLLIEDDAQCFLGYYKNKLVGSIGHASSFSFQSSKHLTAGEGGMVLTNSEDLAIKIRRVSGLGYAALGAEKGKITKKTIQDPNFSRHVHLGWNYRISELCAAVALAQTERITELVGQCIKTAELFQSVLEETKCTWLIPQKVGPEYKSSYWGWSVRLEHEEIDWHRFRDTFVSLGGDGIYAAWRVTYLEPAFQNTAFLAREKFIPKGILETYKAGLCPVAEKLQPKILSFKNMYWTQEDMEKQAAVLKQTIEAFS